MQEKKSNVVLIGMAGAGKSTIGVLAAKALGMDFLDTDLLIQQQTGKLLQETIDEDGIDAFLAVEQVVLCGVDVKNTVVATGGSAVYSDAAMESLSREGVIVYLDVPFSQLEKRLTNVSTRGIVIKKGNTLRDVYDERLPLYRKWADITIDCSGEDMAHCSAEASYGTEAVSIKQNVKTRKADTAAKECAASVCFFGLFGRFQRE